jgi:hypothetical protein
MPDPNQQSGQELLSTLKSALNIQGDFRDILKDSIKELDKTLSSYDKILAKVGTINKSAINTKDINASIKKTVESQFTNKQKLVDLETKFTALGGTQIQQANDLLSKINQIKNLEDEILTSTYERELEINQELAALENQLTIRKNSLDIEVLAYAEAVKKQELDDKALEVLNNQLATEKKIAKTVGVAGGLAEKFAKNLNIGTETYEAMVEKARELEGTNKWFKSTRVLFLGMKSAIKEGLQDPLIKITLLSKGISGIGSGLKSGMKQVGSAAKALSGGDGVITGITSGLSSMVEKIPMIGGLLSGFIGAFSAVADLAIGINDSIIKAGRNLNLSSQEAIKLNRHFQDISRSNGDVFVTSKKLLESQVELGNQLEINNILSDEELATNIKLKDIVGIEADTRANIVENSKISGKTSEGLVKSVFAQVAGLQKATGISLNYKNILKEANSLGGYLGLSFSKYPEKISKALVTTKALGLNLKEVDSLASSFLDFESSITKQFEAQLLTGKDINLQTARQLFLNNDLAGAAAEINKQVGSSSEFLGMNRIAAESLAESFGMSRDSMAEMLKKQEFLSLLGAKDTDNAREQLRLGLEKYHNQEALVEKIGEEAYQNLLNASTQEKIGAFMDKIKNSLVDFIERSGLLDKLTNFIDGLSDPTVLNSVIGKIQSFFSGAINFFGELIADISELISHIPGFDKEQYQNYAADIRAGAARAAESVNSVGRNTQESINVNALLANYKNNNQSAAASSTNNNNKPAVLHVHSQTTLENQAIARNSATYLLSFGFLDNQQSPVAVPFNIGHKGQTPAITPTR